MDSLTLLAKHCRSDNIPLCASTHACSARDMAMLQPASCSWHAKCVPSMRQLETGTHITRGRTSGSQAIGVADIGPS